MATSYPVGIVGLGLIGGSLALDLTALGHTVLGVSRRLNSCTLACARGAVTLASQDERILRAAQVVFVAVPIGEVLPTVARLAQILPEGTVITDVASVKGSIVTQATELWPWFIGGHPMAGTADQGMAHALRGLFRDRPYVLTPIAQTCPVALAQVMALVDGLGARRLNAAPPDHDQAVALISHLPVLISAALVLSAGQSAVLPLAQALASSGFADTSRVGGGNPQLGRQMAQFNRAALLLALQIYQGQLEQFHQIIADQQWPQLEQRLHQSQSLRPDFVN